MCILGLGKRTAPQPPSTPTPNPAPNLPRRFRPELKSFRASRTWPGASPRAAKPRPRRLRRSSRAWRRRRWAGPRRCRRRQQAGDGVGAAWNLRGTREELRCPLGFLPSQPPKRGLPSPPKTPRRAPAGAEPGEPGLGLREALAGEGHLPSSARAGATRRGSVGLVGGAEGFAPFFQLTSCSRFGL